MSRRSKYRLSIIATLLGLAGCSTYVMEQRPAWRAQAELACLAHNVVQESPYIRAANEMSGPGICGLTHPFKVTALAEGTVTLNSTATLDCPMIAALDTWIKEVVQPAAQARFGEPVARINSMGSYSCRGINNMSGANLSEHAFGNAIDVGGFVLASGREVNIMRGFNGSDEQDRAFLHEAHAGACGYFTTVLGPGYNIFHYNHFHVDLAMHGSTSRGPRRYCKPVPEQTQPEPPKRDNLPDPPPVEEEMDIARGPPPALGLGTRGSTFLASVPPEPPSTRAAAYSPLPQPSSAGTGRPPERLRQHTNTPPPIVTFADVDPASPSPHRLHAGAQAPDPPPPEAPPSMEPASGAVDGTPDGGQGMGEAFRPEVPGAAAESDRRAPMPPREIRPAEGPPADWEATSSVK